MKCSATSRLKLSAGLPSAEQSAEAEHRAQVAMARWRLSAVDFALNELGFEPDPEQLEVLRAFPESNRIALVASKNTGKTAVEAVCIWNFFASRPDPKIAVLSVTEENLRDNLWAELGKWYRRSAFLQRTFKFESKRITLRGGNPLQAFISARNWKRRASKDEIEDTIAGLHEEFALIVCDEANGIDSAVIAACEGVLAGGTETKLVIGGNPTHTGGPLYAAATKERKFWRLFFMNGDPDNPKRSPRVSLDWAKSQVERYGRRSPWVQINVLGQFPERATDGVVSVADFEEAYGRTHDAFGEPLKRGPRSLGLDVARGGSNWNVLVFRDGDFIDKIKAWQGKVPETIGHAKTACKEWLPRTDQEWHGTIYVDDVGVGGPVTDQLQADHFPAQGVIAQEATTDDEYFCDRRTQVAGALGERYRDGRISIDPSLREQVELGDQVTTIWFDFDGRGRRKLCDKDAYKAKYGCSSDFWDGKALAFWDEVFQAGAGASGDEEEQEPRARVSPFRTRIFPEPDPDVPDAGALGRRRLVLRVRT